MKNIIVKGIIFIIIGFYLGHVIFGTKIELARKINKKETYYFLQQGVYSDKESLKVNSKDLSQKVVDYSNNKYYVYVGITKDKNIAEKIMKIYKEQGISLHKKEKNINSKEFKSNVEQFDLLINSTNDKDEILTIEEVVLANYNEIIKKE